MRGVVVAGRDNSEIRLWLRNRIGSEGELRPNRGAVAKRADQERGQQLDRGRVGRLRWGHADQHALEQLESFVLESAELDQLFELHSAQRAHELVGNRFQNRHLLEASM